MEPKFNTIETTEPDGLELKLPRTDLDVARERFDGFFSGLNKTINGYYGTGDITFTVKPGGWYIDFKKLEVNADPQFFIDKGYTKSEALFATFHEAEHFRDMIRDADAYTAMFDRLNSSVEHHPGFPSALRRLYNCLDDILVNNSVMSRWNAGADAKNSLYPKLFPWNDLSVHPQTGEPQPRHRQFMYALLREAMLPHEPCVVSPEVRSELNRVQAYGGSVKLVEMLTAVDKLGEGLLSVQDRFAMIQGLIEPMFLELFKKDVEDQKQDEKNEGNSPKGRPKEGEFGEDPFDDAIPDPLDFDDLQKEVKKINDQIAKNKKDLFESTFGVTEKDYKKYERDYKIVEKHIEQLSRLFDEVVQRRKIVNQRLRRSVVDGVMLHSARIATAVAEVKSGNTDPRAMLDYEERESVRIHPSKFEFTLVCDGSGSMQGEKANKQRQLAVLIMEALQLFQNRLEKERRNGQKISLNVSSEVRIFSDADTVAKPLSTELRHADRVAAHKKLIDMQFGNNNEPATFAAIEQEQFNRKRIEELQNGEIKKVILFLTDGETDTSAVQGCIKRLMQLAAPTRQRKTDALVIAGIGFDGGSGAIQTYAPHGFYAASFDEIYGIFSKILAEVLDDL